MTPLRAHIPLGLLIGLVLLSSCAGKARIIPEQTFEEIYIDMFLADQWLADHKGFKNKADSTLFFDPIFESHGYDFEDFDATCKYYASNPEQYWELMTRVSDRISEMATEISARANQNAENIRTNTINTIRYRPSDFDSRKLPLNLGAVYDSLAREDSLHGPKLIRWMAVQPGADTVRIESIDSLELRVSPRPRAVRAEKLQRHTLQ